MTAYQSNLVVFDDIKNMLNTACNEGHSGVLFISSANGVGAGFSLDNGKIVDVAYKTMRGNKALLNIKNIERARFFFGQGELTLPVINNVKHDLPDTAHILNFLNMTNSEILSSTKDESIANRRVMIINDSYVVRSIVKQMLIRHDYEVFEAGDAESALFIIDNEQPDLVVLDHIMSSINGKDILRRIRATEFGKNLPAVILTSDESLLNKNIVSGSYCLMPFKPNDLLLMISDLLSSDR